MELTDLFEGIFKGKKVLITGDTGFKGSWLSIWLHEMGADVYGYALPCKTSSDNFVKCKLDKIINHRDGDIRDRNALICYFEQVRPEIVFHLAAQALVFDSYTDPHGTFETNLMGTVNFLEAVRGISSVKTAINITSDKCYKNREWIWGYREQDPMGGKDPYSASKGCSELITNAYIQSFFSLEGTANIATVRAGNVIGGGDWANYRIIPDFFRAVNSGESLTLRNPDSIRPWQFVLEPLLGYLLLTKKLYVDGKKFSGAWNFGPSYNNQYSVKTLIEKIISYIGKGTYKIDNLIQKKYEASLLNLDISKAHFYLNWSPKLNFDQTIKFTADGYLAEYSSGDELLASRIKQINEYINFK